MPSRPLHRLDPLYGDVTFGYFRIRLFSLRHVGRQKCITVIERKALNVSLFTNASDYSNKTCMERSMCLYLTNIVVSLIIGVEMWLPRVASLIKLEALYTLKMCYWRISSLIVNASIWESRRRCYRHDRMRGWRSKLRSLSRSAGSFHTRPFLVRSN